MLDQAIQHDSNINDIEPEKQFEVTVSRGSLFLKLFIYAILTIVTVGIYRFWAKTKIRKYLWENISFHNDSFEYLGKATELLLGFLMALVFLIPLGLIDAGARYGLELFGSSGLLIAYNVIYVSVIIFLIEFAFYRMRRYQLTRTAWRGIRFNLEGSAVRYAAKSMLWNFSLVFSFGLTMPWVIAWQNKQYLNNTMFGQTYFITAIKAKDFMKPYFILYAVGLLISIALFMQVFPVFSGSSIENIASGDIDFTGLETGSLTLSYGALFIWTIIGLLILNLIVLKTTINKTSIGDSPLRTTFSIKRLVLLNLAYMGATILFFIVVGIILSAICLVVTIGSAAMIESFDDLTVIGKSIPQETFIYLFFGAFALTYILTIIFNAVLFPVALLREIFRNTTVENKEALFNTLDNPVPTSNHGEGFADALDVGAF
ncbi:DUF898 family protein [Rhodospirillaceae bacterium RKSG073]|nr:DUF898 family protein [Curvivirga aplysinae]